MPQVSWEKEGGSSAVLFPIRQVAGLRWRCKVLNYPKLYLDLLPEELESTWQTVPRIDPKWYNLGSRWVPIARLFVNNQYQTALTSRAWSWVERNSYELTQVDEYAQVVLINRRSPDRVLSHHTRVHSLVHQYVRLWNEPFPTEVTPYRMTPVKPREPRAEPQRISALDHILQDDD